MATKIENKSKFEDRALQVRKSIKKFNKESVNISYEIVEESVALGNQWQALFAKSLKKSTKLFGKQQDIVLTALEEIKDQVITNNDKALKLLELDKFVNRLNKRVTSVIKPAVEFVENKISPQVSKVAGDVEEKIVAVKKTTKRAKASAKKTVKSGRAKINKSIKTVTKTDLSVITGIGPKTKDSLAKAGINTYNQLAKTSETKLVQILENAGLKNLTSRSKGWIAQAKKINK